MLLQKQLPRQPERAEWQESEMDKILALFGTFLKIGAFTFGGGYAMIPLLENEFIHKRKWITKEEFLDMLAIAESTPGPAAVNSATYIGYKIAGIYGAAAATVAVSLPSFVIIYAISLFLDQFLALKYVEYAFKGIQVCVVYLILSAGVSMAKGLSKNILNVGILFVTIVAMVLFSLFAVNFSTIYFILISGTVGILSYAICRIRNQEGHKR